MKKINSIFFASVTVVLAMVSCQKVEQSIEDPQNQQELFAPTIRFYANAIETKTSFGTLKEGKYPTLWTDNDSQIKLQQNLAAPVNASVTPGAGYTTADFTPASTIASDGSGSYTFYAVSPASAFNSWSTKFKDWTMDIPASQTPSESSVDESAQLLAATSATTLDFPSSVGFDFTHLTAYGLISLSNFVPDVGETVSSIALTAPEAWVGRWYWYPADYETHTAGEWASTASSGNTITINTSSYTDVWFACKPVDLSGQDIDVVVTTNQGTYSKTITIPAGKAFEAGRIAKFRISMSGVPKISPVVYNLVTDPDELTVGSEVIIVANGASNSDYAMGAQNGSIRNAVAITKSGSVINSPSASVSVFTLGRGTGSNHYSFAESTNYLAAIGGGNNLGTTASLDASATWKISIADGVTTVVSTNPSVSQVNMRYNYNTGNPRFACYASGQDDVAIYKLDGSGDDDDIITYINMPATLAATVGTPSVLSASTNSSASITYESDNTDVATVNSSGQITPKAAGYCTITASVTAIGSYEAVSAECVVTVTGTEIWQETALGSIGASDIFVIVGTNVSSGDTYAMANDGGSSNDPSMIAVAISDGKISGTVANNMKWNVTGNSTDGYVFYPNGSTTTWLYCRTTAASGTNNNLRVGNDSTRKLFT
ncbi:MAG: Ig-like domain-containing protein, partial [Bacteroidales bacterium]|nr:Ig-like domain-containing protein [Bacteroidales bacterium]